MINRIEAYNLPNINQSEIKAKEIGEAASEFESIFIYYMLKTMRESVMKVGLFGDDKAEEIYRGMLDEEISKVIAKSGGIGLKDAIVKGVSNNVMQGSGQESVTRAVIPDLQKDTLSFKMPLKGEISSIYGIRKDPIVGDERFHHGVDIAAVEGAPVHPAMDGVVVFSGEKEGYGNLVEIRHDNGYITRYAHNRRNVVKEGDRVLTSDIIAEVGKTGRVTGPHLHFEVRIEGIAVNPMNMVNQNYARI